MRLPAGLEASGAAGRARWRPCPRSSLAPLCRAGRRTSGTMHRAGTGAAAQRNRFSGGDRGSSAPRQGRASGRYSWRSAEPRIGTVFLRPTPARRTLTVPTAARARRPPRTGSTGRSSTPPIASRCAAAPTGRRASRRNSTGWACAGRSCSIGRTSTRRGPRSASGSRTARWPWTPSPEATERSWCWRTTCASRRTSGQGRCAPSAARWRGCRRTGRSSSSATGRCGRGSCAETCCAAPRAAPTPTSLTPACSSGSGTIRSARRRRPPGRHRHRRRLRRPAGRLAFFPCWRRRAASRGSPGRRRQAEAREARAPVLALAPPRAPPCGADAAERARGRAPLALVLRHGSPRPLAPRAPPGIDERDHRPRGRGRDRLAARRLRGPRPRRPRDTRAPGACGQRDTRLEPMQPHRPSSRSRRRSGCGASGPTPGR